VLNVPPIGLTKPKLLNVPVAGTGAYANVYRPASSADWTALAGAFPGIIVPKWLYLCQEAAGSLSPTITPGGVTTLSPGGTVLYQQTVPDWTTKWVGTAGTGGDGFVSGVTSLWNVTTSSLFALEFTAFPVLTGSNRTWSLYSTTFLRTIISSTGLVEWIVSAASFGSFGYGGGAAYPFCFMFDRRGAGFMGASTNKEALSSTYAAPGGNGVKGFGVGAGTAANARFNYWAIWDGTDAETMMDRGGSHLGAKKLIQDLGWPMAY
jgi:hypothetical protein